MVPPMSLPGHKLLLAIVVAAGLGLVGQASAYAADGFLSVADDVPLMPGLSENPDEATVFDKPGGRIVQAVASGRLDRQALLAFYGQTLPQLGWQPASASRFTREAEALTLTVESRGGLLTVRFEIAPIK